MLFISQELMQKCTEIEMQLDLILADDERKTRPEITINGVMINFDGFEILLVTENCAYLKLLMHGEKVAFIDVYEIKEIYE